MDGRASGGTLELWGFHGQDVDRVRRLLEQALDVAFTLHESDTIGPYFFAPLCGSHAELTLRANLDADFDEETDDPDESLAEPDFPDFGVLLYVDWTTTAHDCRARFGALGDEAQLLTVE